MDDIPLQHVPPVFRKRLAQDATAATAFPPGEKHHVASKGGGVPVVRHLGLTLINPDAVLHGDAVNHKNAKFLSA
jgi:hypothetical protein